MEDWRGGPTLLNKRLAYGELVHACVSSEECEEWTNVLSHVTCHQWKRYLASLYWGRLIYRTLHSSCREGASSDLLAPGSWLLVGASKQGFHMP